MLFIPDKGACSNSTIYIVKKQNRIMSLNPITTQLTSYRQKISLWETENKAVGKFWQVAFKGVWTNCFQSKISCFIRTILPVKTCQMNSCGTVQPVWRSITSSPSFVPAWALAGTWWDRCKCSSSYSQQLAPSAPHSHSSRSGCPKKTGSWTTYHLGGGERKGCGDESTVMGPEIRWSMHRFKQKAAEPSHNEKLMTSLFLLPWRDI